jgi:hypothetical protein
MGKYRTYSNSEIYGGFAIILSMIGLFGLLLWIVSHLPPQVGTWEFWSGGSIAPLNVVGFTLTAIVGVVSVVLLLWRNIINTQELREQQKAAVADRYKTGAELLSSDRPTVASAGILVLQELAIERSDEYGLPIVDLLAAHVSVSGRPRYKAALSNHTKSVEEDPVTEAALRSLGTIQRQVPSLVRSKLHRPVISRTEVIGNYRDIDLSGLSINSAIFNGNKFTNVKLRFTRMSNRFTNVTFDGCDMSEFTASNITFKIQHGTIYFTECNLTDANISGNMSISLSYCNLSGAKISRVRITKAHNCYFGDGRPPDIEAFMDEDIKVYNAGERYSDLGRYRPTAATQFSSYSNYVEMQGEDDDIPF